MALPAWSVKGIDKDTRQIAKESAQDKGMTLGEWLDHIILTDSDDIPMPEPSNTNVPLTPPSSKINWEQILTEIHATAEQIEPTVHAAVVEEMTAAAEPIVPPAATAYAPTPEPATQTPLEDDSRTFSYNVARRQLEDPGLYKANNGALYGLIIVAFAVTLVWLFIIATVVMGAGS